MTFSLAAGRPCRLQMEKEEGARILREMDSGECAVVR